MRSLTLVTRSLGLPSNVTGQCSHHGQAQQRRAAVELLTLRRTRAEVGPPPPPLLEVAVPVPQTDFQAALYRTVLTRHFELLADPKPPRHAGHRCTREFS